MESLTGGLQKRCTIRAQGSWDAASQTVTFAETFTFDDGHRDTLHWKIKKLGPGNYSGTDPRPDGEAQGEQAGCAYHWKYATRPGPTAL